jgi:ABC-type dipeptide/oligopeptide/nickel transport system permease subunit
MSEQVLDSPGVLRKAAPVLQLSYTLRLQKIGLTPTLVAGLVLLTLIILVIAAMSILGPGLIPLYIGFGLVGWIPYARMTRGETLATRNLEYVQAARTIGCTSQRIMPWLPGFALLIVGVALSLIGDGLADKR